MNISRVVLILILSLALSTASYAAFVQVSAVGGPFVTDTNFTVIVKVFDNNGAAKNNIDLNTYVVNLATGAASKIRYDGNVQGVLFRNDINLATAGDYNVVAVDFNDNITARVQISIGSIKTVVATFHPHNPPFNANNGEDINFTLQARNSAGSDVNVVLRARLLSDANNGFASPAIDVNANGRDQNAFSTTGLSQGLYFIDVNSGLAKIPVTVFKFKGFADLQDDQNNSSTVFGTGKTVNIIARATNFDGNVNSTISSLSLSVTDPEGDTNSSIPCTGSTQRNCKYVVRSDANAGNYTVTATITVGSDSLTVRRSFSVQNYELKFFAQKFTGGDAGNEKMPSIYPSNSQAGFEAHFVTTSTGVELSGSDLNGAFCQDANISVFISVAGSKDRNGIADTTTWSSGNPNYCVVTITAPATQGNYVVTASARFGSATLEKSTMLVVQNFMIFMSPVAPDTYDASTPSGKFSFFKGESVGLNPNYVDLNGSLSPKISRVTAIKVRESDSVRTFTGSDVNWNSDKNIVTLSASAVSTLNGGFKPVEATVDVNSADANYTGIIAFGMFKLSTMNLTATVVDSNVALTASAKEQQFGPVSVAPDENIFIKVAATTGSSGVSGATVSLLSLRNVETWQEVTTSGIGTKVTDANGIAILDVGKLNSLGLSNGGYFGEVKVLTSDGNSDTTEFFFESRSFMAFLQPLDRSSGTQCNFVQNFRRDQNASFIVRAFNPRQGFGTGDINVTVPSGETLNMFFFGSANKPQFPPSKIANITYDVNSAYPCMAGGPGQQSGQTRNFTMITVRGANDANWTTGAYSPSLTVVANGGDLNGTKETGRGFMLVQSFTFLVNPAARGQFGPPTGKPGQPFDINVTVLGSTGDVNITAELVDPMGGGKFEFQEGGQNTQDLNIGFATADVAPVSNNDCNATRCPLKGIVVKSASTPSDRNVLSVIIPSNAKIQEYLVKLTATDTTGSTAEGEIFLKTNLYKIVNFGWYSSLFAAYGGSALAPPDWNTALVSSYDQAYQYVPMQGGGGSMGPPTIDFNYLVDFTNRRLIVDLNADRNFMSAGDTNINIGGDINNMYKLIDLSRVGNDPAVKFIRTSSLSSTESTFGYIGVYPADTNFTIPIMVKDVNGSGIDANVTVTNIAKFSPGSYFPQNMAARSCSSLSELTACHITGDFNSLYGKTDGNGFATLNLRVANPGSFLMLELTIWNTSSGGTVLSQTQKLQPFDGPTLDIKKYTITTKIAGPTFQVNYDTNRLTVSDLNIFFNPSTTTVDTNIGIYSGLASGRNRLFGDVNADRNFYFVKVDGNTLWIDDDKNISLANDGANEGAITTLACGDLNSECNFNFLGQSPNIYWNRSTGTDGNAFDGNVVFYPVYQQPFGMQGISTPNKDANIQIVVSLSNLAGTPLNSTTYSISDIRLENYAQFQTESLTPSSYLNKTGPTIINIGSFSARRAGTYNLVFRLTVGQSITEERAYFEVRN
ncbi:MAG: hypothetical protein HY544_00830 [Candidatus Diapherotrites archaeon]|uniref:Uncharacterized protein n=1 Tax=Candidatus Iainarchaeum sp. TaxID=3101447 RepID=A0A8T3YKB6_9ARCH|nr:hypothetical protein [Candidatus Diapherotrites archaeon]